jgi:dihydrodipicolinate reductase
MKSKKILGVGIVGCGNVSTIYMQNMGKFAGLKLVACADVRTDAAEAQAAAHGIEARSFEKLLSCDDIDIVVNLTTPKAQGNRASLRVTGRENAESIAIPLIRNGDCGDGSGDGRRGVRSSR